MPSERTAAVVEPSAVVTSRVRMGSGVYVGHLSVLGSAPEDTGQRLVGVIADGPHEGVVIEDDVIIRDRCVVHGGKVRATTVGVGAYLHSGSHVDHDCALARNVVLAPGVYLAGDVEVAEGAQIGMCAAVHQRVQIGAFSMIAMNASVVRSVPAFALVMGTPGRVVGANRVLLARRGVDAPTIEWLSNRLRRGEPLLGDTAVRLPEWIVEILTTDA